MKLTEKIEQVQQQLPSGTEVGQTLKVTVHNTDIELDMDLGYTPEARMGDFELEFEKTEQDWELKNVFQSIL